jgi:alkylation response protein AidB-like acyl-CoA dehydrogenase
MSRLWMKPIYLYLYLNCSRLLKSRCPPTVSVADEPGGGVMLARSDRISGYLGAIHALAPLIASNREAFDRDRRLPDLVVKALAEAGLFRLWLPEKLGGPELSPFEFMTVVEAASALDGSVGWLVGNGGGMGRIGGYLPETVVRKWFADLHAFVASATGAAGTAIRTAGGYRVTGRWPFGSGAHHATWFMGLGKVKGSEEPPFCCYFESKNVRVHDTWQVSGLRGTGSCDFEVRDVFVPNDHTHRLTDPEPSQPGLLYRLPGLSAFAWTVSVVPLGIARGAIDTFAELAGKKTRVGNTVLLRDRETVQATVGRAEALYRAGRAFLIDAMTELMAATDVGGTCLVQARAMFRVACAHAAENATRIVEMIAADVGAVSIFETCALERAIRDVHAATKHIAMSSNSYIVGGRLALGLDPGTPRF